MLNPIATQITPPRVNIIDPKTGYVSREWYRWFYSLYQFSGGGTGVLPVTSGGTGLGTIPTDGQLLIGDGSGYRLNTLTAGTAINVVNNAGTITVNNTGVTSLAAGSGVSIDQSTGDVTVTNTGVTSFSAGSTGLTPSTATGGDVVLAGTLDVDSGGTGQTSYINGQLLIGNTAGNTLTKATLTAGTGITITNGAGAITVATNGTHVTSAPVTQTANFSVGATDTWIINNKSGSTCAATLPSPAANVGRVLHFQNYQDQLLISTSSNVVPRAGGAATTAILSDVAGDTATLVSDGSNWVMTQYTPNNELLLE